MGFLFSRAFPSHGFASHVSLRLPTGFSWVSHGFLSWVCFAIRFCQVLDTDHFRGRRVRELFLGSTREVSQVFGGKLLGVPL